jgi:hypothetical protein
MPGLYKAHANAAAAAAAHTRARRTIPGGTRQVDVACVCSQLDKAGGVPGATVVAFGVIDSDDLENAPLYDDAHAWAVHAVPQILCSGYALSTMTMLYGLECPAA